MKRLTHTAAFLSGLTLIAGAPGLTQADDIELFVDQMCNVSTSTGEPPCVIIMDDETLDTDLSGVQDAANDCSAVSNSDQLLGTAAAAEQDYAMLPWTTDCVSSTEYWVESGQNGDEGMFLLPPYDPDDPYIYFYGGEPREAYIPWLRNYLLGTLYTIHSDPTKLQDKVVGVKPVRNADIAMLKDTYDLCMALVKESDVSLNFDAGEYNANLQGKYRGHFWFDIVESRSNSGQLDEIKIVAKSITESSTADWLATWIDDLGTAPEAGALRLLQVPAVASAPTVTADTANQLFHENHTYLSLFRPDIDLGWIGNIKKYYLCQDPSICELGELLDVAENPATASDNTILNTAQSLWSSVIDGSAVNKGGAGEKLPTHQSRTVYTYLGTDDSPSIPATLDVYHVNNSSITLTMLGGAPTDPVGDRAKIMDWYRGKDVKDEDDDTVTEEDRPWAFPSPLHSRPKIVLYADPGGGDPIEKIVVGLHDGTVRFLDGATGIEQFAFAAPSLLTHHKDMYAAAGTDGLWGLDLAHVYGVDGSPQVLSEDTDGDGTDDKHTLIIGMRRGGETYYALDISADSNGAVTPKFLWRITAGDIGFGKLGQTWSAPLPADILVTDTGAQSGLKTRTALIFGGGYNIDQDSGFTTTGSGNGLYLVDPADGSKLLSIGGLGFGADVQLPGMVYAIPGDLAPVDSDGDGNIDRIYFADTGGQVWRVDLSPTLSESSGGRLAVLATGGTAADERRFYEPPEVTPVTDNDGISKIKQYDIVSIGSGYRAHPLDQVIEDRLYAIRDYLIDSSIELDGLTQDPTNYPQCGGGSALTTCSGPLTESDLADVTNNLIQVGTTSEVTAAELALSSKEGWYMKFENLDGNGAPELLGEKSLAATTVIDGVLLATSYIPPQSCNAWEGQGTSRLYAVDLLSGEAVFEDFDGITGLDTSDRYMNIGKGMPSKVVPIFQEGGVTMLIGAGGGAETNDPGIAPPVVTTFWYKQ